MRCRSSPSTSRWGSPGESARHRPVPPHRADRLARGCRRARPRAPSRTAVVGLRRRRRVGRPRTCNRLEVYAEALTFHGAVAAIGESLADVAGVDRAELTAHLYVHFEDRAIAHAFSVAAGLDSMAVGEAQVLGQLRDALRAGQRAGTVGESLNALLQQALRVGKRAHHETAIDTRQPLAGGGRPRRGRARRSATSRPPYGPRRRRRRDVQPRRHDRRPAWRRRPRRRQPHPGPRRAAGRGDRRARRRDGPAGRRDRRGRRRRSPPPARPSTSSAPTSSPSSAAQQRARPRLRRPGPAARRRPRRRRPARDDPGRARRARRDPRRAGGRRDAARGRRPCATSSPARWPATSRRGW